MQILFTGGSSFTGCWFISALAHAGHTVVATFRNRPEDYKDALRRKRIEFALAHAEGVFECSFGDPEFLALAGSRPWDMFCHHAAEVTDYKSENFDVASALQANTRNLAQVVGSLTRAGGALPAVLLTGSVFENDAGAGSDGLPAFSPYGLSKAFTYQAFRYHTERAKLPLGRFVISNPFGPLEEPRFTAYLMRTWLAGGTATVNTPAYVRDNIHVSLLAKSYAQFADLVIRGKGARTFGPSGYVETQGAFALRFAKEMQQRFSMPCALELKQQTEFPEPRVRINTDHPDTEALLWNETEAWDNVAAYYRQPLIN